MKNFKIYTILCLLAALALGCRKQEFQLPPVGAEVPYQDSLTNTWRQSLAQSDAKLFYQAWQRGNMDSVVKAVSNGKTQFTILALSDAALIKNGYDQTKIQSMAVKDIDSLLMYCTLRQKISQAILTGREDNYVAYSLLRHPLYITNSSANNGSYELFTYKQYLQLQNGKTYVNGKPLGSGKYTAANDGYIWFLDDIPARSTKTIYQTIINDNRFSMLLGILAYNDQRNKDTVALIKKTSNKTVNLNRATFFDKEFNWSVQAGNILYSNTVFLPTDDAFKAAGFNSLAALEKFNRGNSLTIGKDGGNNMVLQGFYSTDSLLAYHCDWGIRFINIGPVLPSGGPASPLYNPFNAPDIYSNVMNNSILQNVVISPSELPVGGNGGKDPSYYIPFDFSKDASGNIQLKVIGSDATPATIIDADIMTIQGPIHVVNRLLIPKGFIKN